MKPPIGSLSTTTPIYGADYIVLFRTYDDAIHDFRVLARPDPGELCIILEHRPLGFSRVLLASYGPVWVHTEEAGGDAQQP
jgi:hypothetical protein